jgi:DNA replication protein DnaT
VARIRTVKPSFWGDGAVSQVTREARLLMIGLISMADDEGRFLGSVSAISGFVFPNDELPQARVKKWLAELEKAGLIHLYSIDGIRYGAFLGWHKHQKISHPQASPLPPPQGELFSPHSMNGSGGIQ